MRILLCIPVQTSSYQATPDLGLGYLATALLRRGHEVKILDSVNLGLDYDGFRKHVSEYAPDMVGIKVFSKDIKSAKKCMGIVKEVDDGIVGVVGGPHPSTASPEEVMGYFNNVDYAFKGEADNGLPELIENLGSVSDSGWMSGVPGLIYRDGGAIKTNPQDFISDLDSLGMPAWELMPPTDYGHKEDYGFFIDKFPVAYIIATRGCPYKCSYCASHLITGRKVRYRSIGNVIAEIKYLKDTYGIKVFNVVDDNIALNNKYIIGFCETLIKEKVDLEWHCPYGVRLDSLNPEVVQSMYKSGCRSIAVGIESGDDEVLAHMNKRLTTSVVREKLEMIKANSDMYVHGNFIIGYPTEKRENILRTIKFAKSLPLDLAAFAPFRPTPGSPIYTELEKEGLVRDLDWDSFLMEELAFVPPGMTKKELQGLRNKAYREFYTQPRIIWGFIKSVRSLQQIKVLLRRVKSRMFHG